MHLLCAVEELMPSIGTIVPPPAVLATTIWQSESIFHNIDKQSQDLTQMQSSHFVISDTNSNQNMYQRTMTYLTSISEDGKIWSWHLSFDKSACSKKVNLGANQYVQSCEKAIFGTTLNQLMIPFLSLMLGRNQVHRTIVMREFPTHALMDLISQ